MASLINTIVTKFTAEGAEQTAAATENITKAQTRLGQTSASNGRQFAAQAQGLGGIVAAYAGAAANIFAITQAFDALSRAARADQTIAGTKALAAQIGESGSSIVKSLKDITNGQLSAAQAAESANIALSAGFDSKQLQGLTEVAFKASRVLGRDLTDSIQRVIRGTSKLEPELLDELGIFTRIEPAVEKYASRLGVTAASLTEFQRRQAFANAAIEEGQRKFGVIQVSADTTQASFERVAATFSDLAQKIGSIVAGTIAPVFDFLSKNIGTALLAIAALGSIVFKNLLGQVGEFVRNTVTGLETVANSTKGSKAQFEAFTKAATEAQVAAQKGLEGAGRFIGAGGVGAAGKSALERAAEGKATRTQMQSDLPAIKAAIDAEKAYRTSIEDGTRVLKDKTKALEQNQTRIDALTGTQKAYEAALSSAGRGTQLLTTLTVGLQRAMTVLGVVIGAVGTALNVIAIGVAAAQIIGTLFDVDILGAISAGWDKLREGSRNLKAGIEGLTASIANSDATRLRGLFSTKEIEDVAKNAQAKIAGLISVTDAELKRQQTRLRQAQETEAQGGNINPQRFRGLVTTVGNIDSSAVESLNKEFNKFGITIEKVGNTSRARITELKDGVEGLTTLNLLPLVAQQAKLQEQLSKTAATSPKFKELTAELEAVKIAIAAISTNADVFTKIAGSIAKELEIGTDKVQESFKRQGIEIDNSTNSIKLNGVVIGTINDRIGELNKTSLTYAASATRVENITNEAAKGFASGAATSEGLSKNVNGAVTALEKLREATYAQIMADTENEESVTALIAAYKKQEQQVKAQVKALEELQTAERITRNLEKQFGTERQAFEESVAKGLISSNGKIAESDAEVSKNRLSFLQRTVETGVKAAESLAKATESDPNRSLYAEQIKAGNIAAEAAVGAATKLAIEVKKTNDELDKRILSLKNETFELAAQASLAEIRRDLAEAQAQFSRDEANRQSIITKELEIQKRQVQDKIDASRADLTNTNRRLDGEQAILEAQAKQARAASALAVARAEGANQAALAPLKALQSAQNDLPNLFTSKERFSLQEAIVKQEYQNNLTIINLREKQAQADIANQIKVLELQRKRVEAEIAQKADEIKRTEDLQKTQATIDASNRQAEAARLNFEVSQAPKRVAELEAQKTLELQKIESSRLSREQELKTIQQRIDIVVTEAKVFQRAAELNTEWVNKYIEAVNKQYGGTEITKLQVTANFDSIVTGAERAKKTIDEAVIANNIIAQQQVDIANNDIASRLRILQSDTEATQKNLERVRAAITAEEQLGAVQNARVLADLQSQKTLLEEKLRSNAIDIATERTKAAESAQNAQNAREAERLRAQEALASIERQRNAFLQLANEISGIIKSNLNKGVDSFFDAIKNGTLTLKNFKQGLLNLFKDIFFDIAKAITKELLVKPITDSIGAVLRGAVSSVFGPEAGKALGDASAKALGGTIANVNTGTCGCITDAVKSLPGAATSAAANGAPAAVNAATNGAPAVVNAATNAAPTAVNAATQNLPLTAAPLPPPRPASLGGAVTPAVTQAANQTTRSVSATQQIGEGSGPGTNANPLVVEGVQGSATAPILGSQLVNPAGGAALNAINPTGGAALNSIGGASPIPPNNFNATGSMVSSGYASTTYGPFGMFGSNTLNPTGPGGFGAMGPTTGAGFNGTVTNGMSAFGGPGYATTFGGGTPIGPGNPGSIAGAPGVTSFGPNAFETSGFKFGNRADLGGGGGATEALNEQLDLTKEKFASLDTGTESLTDNFSSLGTDVVDASSGVTEIASSSDIVSGSLASQAVASEGVISAAVAQQATSAALQTADGVEAASSQMVATNGYQAAAALAAVGSAGAGGGLLGLAASGGMVGGSSAWARFAAGGGVMMRDRVPSLLEPGEFVMKKTSVDSIGRTNLERMNATGKSSGGPTNIKVQIENQGAQKEAQQGETQMDGETAIVKLILKDLNSNGPIRRSIRGNM